MKYTCFAIVLLLLAACSGNISVSNKVESYPDIFPDYTDVTIPPNIAPLNFSLKLPHEDARVVLTAGKGLVTINEKNNQFIIPGRKWKQLLEDAAGKSISVAVYAKQKNNWTEYKSFRFHVANEPVDGYLAYRLIEPGYELWNRMGIYQRNLENYTEHTVYDNKMTNYNCVNCHSFCMQNPEKMLFHMREVYPGTILIDGDKVEKLNTKTDQTVSSLVYPSWHPSGNYVAFSVNDTKQSFHTNNRNRIEVFDLASDVVVYDVEKHEIITTPVLYSKTAFETFPTFSPDGKTLYFCSADTVSMPAGFEEVKYSLCSISFDPEKRVFGQTVDTVYNAPVEGKSVSFPRVSPNGKHLLYTLSGYGNFSIWHKDADLYMADLTDKTIKCLDIVNSDDVESYHSWSSNSRWFVFSSRRIDGLYTRPYIAYVDNNGNAGKPFLLPQKDVDFYHRFMQSYNIPEFVTGKIPSRSREIALKAQKDKGTDVTFSLKR